MKKGAKIIIGLFLCIALIGGLFFYNKNVLGKNSDAASEEYQTRDAFCSMTDSSINRMESEHFQIVWGNKDTTGTVNNSFVKGNLENLENIRTCYIEELGMKDPSTSMYGNSSTKYKTNVYIAETGLSAINDDWAYMSVDSGGYGYVVMMPGAMRVDEPSWVVPHEYAHVITYHQGGNVPDGWYEPLANWYRDQYLGSSYYRYGNNVYGPASDFFSPMVLYSDYYFPHLKNYYDAWPLLLYISDNPDNLDGLGKETMLKVINDKKADTNMFSRIARISGIDAKELLGYYSRRMVTLDFERQDCYMNYLNDLLKTSGNSSLIYTTLNKSGDWLTVPDNRAPMQGGYNVVPLNIDLSSKQIDVNFASTSSASDADFRACIVTKTADNTTRYSTLWNNGKNSIALHGDETKAYLVVCATPDQMKNLEVYNLDAVGTRYTYKVQVSTSSTVTVESAETAEPTIEVTQEPTEEVTEMPTVEATMEPTEIPTVEATQEPTEEVTEIPTNEATMEPTAVPTVITTIVPTATVVDDNSSQKLNNLYATLAYTNDWGAGCCATMTISNTGAALLDGWTIEFDYNREIVSLWNAKLISHEGNHYVVEAPGYAKSLSSNESVSFGFLAGEGDKTDTISNVSFH